MGDHEGQHPEDPRAVDAPAEAQAPETLMERMFPTIERRRDRWVEFVAAILLALATVMSAWSAYQATRWSGVQATAFSRAGSLRSESVRASTSGGQLVNIDVQIFLAWVAAVSAGDEREADFLRERFREEFVPAFEAWAALDTDGPGGRIPPGTPFSLDEYQPQDLVEADELERQAAASFEEARKANQTGDNFVLTAVLFASVLFFAGIGTKWRSFRLRVSSLTLGGVMFIAASILVLSLPQNVGFSGGF
jgi:hypothetical protein